ncbi:glycosyltransferase [Akkermansiaceae bacterium]|nr:glycosyltransferase [Akkermansiaceae bacterium]
MHSSKLTSEQAEHLIAEYTKEISSPKLMGDPLVSVCVHTYNHAEFIMEALDSALMQEANFPFEIIIGDDGSTDGASEIIDRYQREYPDKIKILRSAENLGKHTGNGRLNFIRGLRACRGKYIALLEGDDYWTDAKKLQKQVDLLEKYPEHMACFHLVEATNDTEADFPLAYPPANLQHDIRLADLLLTNCCQTCSVVFRAKLMQPYPAWMLNVAPGDWAIFLYLTQYGTIAYIPEKMANYRVHAGGSWSQSSQNSRDKKALEMMNSFLAHADFSLVREQCHDIGSILRARIKWSKGSSRINRMAYRRLFRQHVLALLRSGDRKNNIKTLFA